MKVLIPTDLSEESINNIKNSIILFDRKETKIELIYFLEIFIPQNDFVGNSDEMILNIHKEKMNVFVESLKETLNDEVEITGDVVYGVFKNAMKDKVEDNSVDLVLMLGSVRVGLEKLFLKKKTKSILGEIAAPMLFVPAGCSDFSIKSLGLAVDHSEVLNKKVNAELTNLLTYFEAKLFAFHIDDYSESNSELSEYKEAIIPQNSTIQIINNLDVEKGILKTIDRSNLQIIGLITHDKNFFEKLLFKSVTREILEKNTSMTLIFQN